MEIEPRRGSDASAAAAAAVLGAGVARDWTNDRGCVAGVVVVAVAAGRQRWRAHS